MTQMNNKTFYLLLQSNQTNMAYLGSVIQSGDGTLLTFTDSSTVSGTLTSKILNITDAEGTLFKTVNMGVQTTANFTIAADRYYTFTMTLTDTAGVHVVIVNYLSTAFYEIAFANIISLGGCSCSCSISNKLNLADQFKNAARIEAQLGLKSVAQSNILAANTIINN